MIRKPVIAKAFLSVILLVFSSCLDEENGDSRVVTEDVIYVSGETIRVSGRILSIGAPIDDHGFIISENEDFSSPITISMGEKNTPGRFIGTSTGLTIKTSYFCKSYIVTGGATIYGNVITFNTLTPFVNDFEPVETFAGQYITLKGGNFTSNAKVLFGDQEGTVEDILFESLMKVRVPPIVTPEVPVSVVIDNTTFTYSGKFRYIIGKWSNYSSFINSLQYFQTFSLQYEGKFIFGQGVNSGPYPNNNDKIFIYDINSDSWSEINFTGINTITPFGGGRYFGGGKIGRSPGGFVSSTEFWGYNSTTGQFDRLAELTFDAYRAVAIPYGDDLFVFGGLKSNTFPSLDIYHYTSSTNFWAYFDHAPIEISSEYPYFYQDDDVYFITENDALWKFNIPTDTWVQVNQFPSVLGKGGIAVNTGSKVYIGLAETNRSFYEYDIGLNTWKRKSGYPGKGQEENLGYFANNDLVYVMRTNTQLNSAGNPTMVIWQFDPNGY